MRNSGKVTHIGLLLGALNTQFICADATYKLNWQGYPLLVVGNTDQDRHFHNVAVVVSTHERTEDFLFMFQKLKNIIYSLFEIDYKPSYLMSDAAPAIHNGFSQVFDNSEILMCWAHVRINVVKQTSLLSNKKIKNEIMADLNLVQLSPDNETFKKSFELFCKKYVAEERFLKYIKKEWIDKNGKWYEGASWFMPSTNNALESSNRIIKDQHTLRERLPVSKFKVVLAEMVAGWSISYKNNLKIFKKIPTIDLPLWTSILSVGKIK